LVCATKRTDGRRGKRHSLYRQTMSRWAVAFRGCTLEVKELALISTHEARCRPPRRGARLRSRMVNSNEAGFNLREMIPLPRNNLHSREISALADTRQRLRPRGYRGWLPPSTSPKDEAGDLNVPCFQSGFRRARLGLSDNRHLHDFVESICVNVGGSLAEGCRSPNEPSERRRLHSSLSAGKPHTGRSCDPFPRNGRRGRDEGSRPSGSSITWRR
jgi:hypothetical protein